MNTIKTLETVIDQIDEQMANSLDRDEAVVLKRAKNESMILLRTLIYIYQHHEHTRQTI